VSSSLCEVAAQPQPGGVADDAIEILSDSDEDIETNIEATAASKRKGNWLTAAPPKKAAAKKKKKHIPRATAVAAAAPAAAANTKPITSFFGKAK
jgi:hypothetical protein